MEFVSPPAPASYTYSAVFSGDRPIFGLTMVPTRGFSGRSNISLMPTAPNLGPLNCSRMLGGNVTSSSLTPFSAPSPNRFPEITLRIWGTDPTSMLKSSAGNSAVTISPCIEVILAPRWSNIVWSRVEIPVHVPVDCSAAMASAALSIGRSVVTLYLQTTYFSGSSASPRCR